MRALTIALALGLASSAAAQQTVLALPDAQVFPGTDGAQASSLDAPLTDAIAAFEKKSGKKKWKKRITVFKARRRMDVYADDVLLKSYVVNLGPDASGPKSWEGDGKTPEGDYYVCSVNKVSQFTRFLALAYPTPADADRGLKAGRLAKSDAEAIRAAWKDKKTCPPQVTKLGGMVGIHGKGGWQHEGGKYELVDWTLGCVGLRDADILELFEHYAEVGIPVHIE
ncbi:MAG: L,D-transpeptidase [Deltaproteobacteria bacterium]|nr:L,D-transpeptidase [Deltaproteobacteria bacterium]